LRHSDPGAANAGVTDPVPVVIECGPTRELRQFRRSSSSGVFAKQALWVHRNEYGLAPALVLGADAAFEYDARVRRSGRRSRCSGGRA
jgi:hypothetical protein